MRFALVSLALSACDGLPSSSGTGSTGDTGAGDTETSAEPGSEWTFFTHPCVGNRTDTLWFDDPQTAWVGCGSTADGTGLFRSTDAGESWEVPQTSPPDAFGGFRVDSISRSADGLLYVAGIDTLGSARVLSLADDGAVDEVFASGGQIWNTFQVGTFRRNADGVAVAESLTGAEVVARFGDADPWQDGYGWWGGGDSFQILDLTLFDDQFYAVGSTIGQPPMVFLPPKGGQDAAVGLQLVPVQLDTYAGELYGVDVDPSGVVVAGVDQDRGVGHVFTSGPDPFDLESWRNLDVSTMFPSDATWMRGACRSGDTVVAVGEFSRRSAGLVLVSADSGATWSDATPTEIDLPPVQRCAVFPDGRYAIAGADGLLAWFTPG